MIYLHVWTYQTSVVVVYGLGVYFGFIESTWHTFLHGILKSLIFNRSFNLSNLFSFIATIGMIFYEHQTTAFSNFWSVVHIFQLITLATSLFLCTFIKIYIVLIIAVFAFYSPIILEILLRYEKRKETKSKPSKLNTFLAKFF